MPNTIPSATAHTDLVQFASKLMHPFSIGRTNPVTVWAPRALAITGLLLLRQIIQFSNSLG